MFTVRGVTDRHDEEDGLEPRSSLSYLAYTKR
jgi:hypothetical protein